MTTLTAVPEPQCAPAEHTRRTIVGRGDAPVPGSGYGRRRCARSPLEAGSRSGTPTLLRLKEHLVQAFYDQLQAEHAAAAERVLAGDEKFDRRLRGCCWPGSTSARPHHEFAGQFFRNAADPHSPLSPFSPESAPARDASIALFARVRGSDAAAPGAARRVPAALAAPDGRGALLVYDDSPGQQRSRELVTRSVPVVDRLVRLSRLPVIRGVVDDVLGFRAIRSPS